MPNRANAASAASAAKTRGSAAPVKAFTTSLWTWRIDPRIKGGRDYAMLTLPYGELRNLVYITVFNSFDGTGWQREAHNANVRHLYRAMGEDNYTPTVWAAALDKWHVKNLEHLKPSGEDKTLRDVVLHVSEEHPLPLIDGNHRREALERCRAEAEKAGDQLTVNAIDRTAITLQVFLSSEHVHEDFLNFQMGRPVSRNQIKSMEFTYGDLPEEKVETIRFARDVAIILSGRQDSHLQSQIVFDGAGRGLQISSLTADHSSSLATTLYGGALIAGDADKPAAWMADRYCDVYQALITYGEDDPEVITGLGKEIFAPKKILTPLNLQGTKAGSNLLIGIANCLAWRLIHEGKEEPDEDDLIRVAEVANRHLNQESPGSSAALTRKCLGLFARKYFADVIGTGSVAEVDGMPVPLMEILSASTFDVSNALWKAWKADHVDQEVENVEGDDRDDRDEQEPEPETSEPPKPRRGRPRKTQTQLQETR